MTNLTNKPAWVDLATSDLEGSKAFYSTLFGWNLEGSDDPQYGGYLTATRDGHNICGIGPKQMEMAPSAWSLYIGTDDVDALTMKCANAGATVIVPPMAVGDQGKMAVFQDPSGAYFSAWQSAGMNKFVTDEANTYGWAELSARGLAKAIPFYESVFGWTHETMPMGEGASYTMLMHDGEQVAGAMEMMDMVPAEVPSYWLVYFKVDDVDALTAKAIAAGATQMVPPQDAMGLRLSILTDPQGASFGLHSSREG